MSFDSTGNHTKFKEWLYLEADGALEVREGRQLAAHLAGCSECRSEQRAVARLETVLRESVVPVDEGFTREVMLRLPEAGWEARSFSGWRTALVVAVLLGAAAAFLSVGGERLATDLPLAGAAIALLGLFKSALLAGGGLLAASWTGIGLALDRLFEGSRVAFAVFGVLVLGLDLLFLRLLLRYRSREAPSAASPGPGDER